MIKIILGLILLLMPFLLIYKFKDKRIGFFYILSFLIGFHLLIAVLTQLFHIFNYASVVGIVLITDLIILSKINFKEFLGSLKKIKIDWILVFVIIILFIQLFSIHYNYTGNVTTVFESSKEVKNMKYVYPYFSDEWSAVALIKYSIVSGQLPLKNPLWGNADFPNLELPFHSFISEIILLLGLDPLTQYSFLTIFSGILICVLIYFILRFNNLGKLASSIISLSIPYFINGANLPGIWVLIPLIMGIIFMLLSFLFMSIRDNKMVLFTGFLTLIFYPPLFVLSGISLMFYFIFLNSNKEKIRLMLLFLGLCALAVLILSIFVFLSKFSFTEFLSHIFSKIFYETFTKNAIPDFSIWKIIPIPILLFSGFGVFKLIIQKRRLWLVAPVVVGLVYWWIYSFSLWRFIIEYERVVVATSILITLLAGFGLYYLIRYLRKFDFVKKYKLLQIAQILVLVLFFSFSFSYTNRDNWQELKLYSINSEVIFNPAAPANNYLHQDDLELFSDIKQKTFLSIPWKGKVIGVATDNYPLETKSATITNSAGSFSEFMRADCSGKIEIAKQREVKIDYIYSQEFNCSGFELKDVSSEGLRLYKVV